jgi:quercetin dioxygenase-like cupin family protein
MLGAAACLVVAATGASATPGSGITSTSLGRGRAPGGIALSSRGATEVTMSEITIAPGGSTGWHYHDGQVLAIVKSGTLTRTLADCSTEVTPAGESFVEPAGPQSPHVGRNLGTEPVVLLVAYVVPAGDPLARDVPGARCGL